ncbi:cobalamin-dependent protein [Oscillospiraceae bacterium CM]|nr:cobalamin-dependent protein [Oscillospiraceae bacterium CM]
MLDLKALTEAVGALEEEKVVAMLTEFVGTNPTEAQAQEAIAACQDGMGIVGGLFEKGEYFVGDLIFAGELLTGAVNVLKPIIGGESTKKVGVIVLGTVHDDLHDIGKNIFRSTAEAAGFEVYDLGIDQPVSAFVDKVKEVKPDIVGLSGVLTLAIDSMKDTIDGLKAAGLRDSVKVTIGGACASEDAMIVTGADAWSTNAAKTVQVCLDWVKGK